MTLILSGTDGVSDIDGTAATPAIRGTDANTGIFFGTDIIGFSEGGTEAMRINASGNLQTIGTISVGNATPSTSGAGITFPATQSASSDANTLDDYEEGTWTPSASAASGSLTAYSSNGTYTKIGRIVTLFGSITTTTVGTASGTLNFTGVPFNTLGGEQYNGVSREVISTGANHFANISNTSGLLQSITGGGITWVNGYAYKFTVTYQV